MICIMYSTIAAAINFTTYYFNYLCYFYTFIHWIYTWSIFAFTFGIYIYMDLKGVFIIYKDFLVFYMSDNRGSSGFDIWALQQFTFILWYGWWIFKYTGIYWIYWKYIYWIYWKYSWMGNNWGVDTYGHGFLKNFYILHWIYGFKETLWFYGWIL